MSTALLCVFVIVTDYSWGGISFTPTGHCMKHLRKHIIKIQSQKPICITYTVPPCTSTKPQSLHRWNRLYCTSILIKWACVLKDDTWVKGLVKSNIIWKLHMTLEHSIYSALVIWTTFLVFCPFWSLELNQVLLYGKQNLTSFCSRYEGFTEERKLY